MPRNQIISTSCRTNVERAGPGEKAYTYTEGFGTHYRNPEYNALFSYRPPSDAHASEPIEVTLEYMPTAFMYHPIDKDRVGFSQNKYSGYDYRGPGCARRGNILKHVIICDKSDIEQHYPCEYYQSSMFCGFIPYEQLNSEEPPEYMPEPDIITGDEISVEAVKAFLTEEEGRDEIFKRMMYAFLHLNSQRQKVVICDTKENIIYWIAALEYVLPVSLAQSVCFTTYAYNPLDSHDSKICGVFSEGTEYDASSSGITLQTYLFDISRNIIPDVNVTSEFYSFIAESLCTDFSESYRLLEDYHQFLSQFTEIPLNETFSNLYYYYNLSTIGLIQIYSAEEFRWALSSIEYLPDCELRKKKIYNQLLNELDVLDEKPDELGYSVIQFLCENTPVNNIPEMVIERMQNLLVSKFTSGETCAADFKQIYDTVKRVLGNTSLLSSIALQELPKCISLNFAEWKLEFVLELFNECSRVNEDIKPITEAHQALLKEINPSDAAVQQLFIDFYRQQSDVNLSGYLDVYFKKFAPLPGLLMSESVSRISISSPSESDFLFLRKLMNYQKNYIELFKDSEMKNKIVLVVIGMELSDGKDVGAATEAVFKGRGDAALSKVVIDPKNTDTDGYLAWIASLVCTKAKSADDFSRIYKLYKFTPDKAEVFVLDIAENLLSKEKGVPDAKLFAEFLKFVQKNKLNTTAAIEGITKKIDKATFKQLEGKMPVLLSKDAALAIWTEIHTKKENNKFSQKVNEFGHKVTGRIIGRK